MIVEDDPVGTKCV